MKNHSFENFPGMQGYVQSKPESTRYFPGTCTFFMRCTLHDLSLVQHYGKVNKFFDNF